MKKSLSLLLMFMLSAALLVSACAQPAAPSPAASQPAPAPPVSKPAPAPAPQPASPAASGAKVLKFAYDMTKSSPSVVSFNYMAEQLEKQTGGKYKVDFYPSQSLFKSAEALQSVLAGVADFSNIPLASQEQVFPVSNVVCLPSVHFPDTLAGHVAASAAARQLLTKYPVMLNEFKDYKLLFWIVLPADLIMTKKVQVTKPEDLKGLKTAALGLDGDLVKLGGAAAVNILPPDIYDNMSKGVVDSACVAWSHMVTMHYEEVGNYYLDYPLGQTVQIVLMNKNSWNSLPADTQKLISDLLIEAESKTYAAFMTNIEAGIKLVKAKKRTITTLTPEQRKPWDDLFKPVDEAWLGKMKTKGLAEAPTILNDLKQLSAAAWK